MESAKLLLRAAYNLRMYSLRGIVVIASLT